MGLEWLEDLKTDPGFIALSKDEQQAILDGITAGHRFIPIIEDDMDKTTEEQNITAQLTTVLVTLRGEPGSGGGLVGDVTAMNSKIDRVLEQYHAMDKKHDLLKQGNDLDHKELKDDIDGIGRKAERAMTKAEKVESDFEDYRKERIEEKEESRFQWYHAVLGLIGLALAAVELISVLGG